MVTWRDGQIATSDSVDLPAAPGGATLHDRYWDAMRDLTLGLVKRRGNSVVMGPLELLRFGEPHITSDAVEWPIQGGLLAAAPGGRWRVAAEDGRVMASVDGYRPRLPRPIYSISQLQVHLLFTRLLLLRLRGRWLPAGTSAVPDTERRQAALVDIAFCLTVARYTPIRRRPATLLGLIAGYHVACWSTSGKTLGGLVVGQRVVSADGRRVSVAQSIVRLLAIPIAWALRRPVHDEFAGTEVISEK